MLRAYGVHPDDFRFAEQQLNGIPEIARTRLLKKYSEIEGKNEGETRRERNLFLLINTTQTRKLMNVASMIKDPSAAQKIVKAIEMNRHDKLIDIVDTKNFKNAMLWQGKNEDSIATLAKRFSIKTSERAQKQRIRRKVRQGTAYINAALCSVGKNAHAYSTPHEMDMRRKQKNGWISFGSSRWASNGEDKVQLLHLMENANRQRFSELYTLIKGMEQLCEEAGMTWAFVTLTAPAEYHPNPKKGKKKWNGEAADQAHEWISEAWQRARARIAKFTAICGLRVVEPHEDGCPHWHCLLFGYEKNLQKIEKEFRKELSWKKEAGCKFMMNDGTASAASYVTKYVMKTISALEELDKEQAAVDAWRSAWAIRAFQFFGMPSLSLWRELRKVNTPFTDPNAAELEMMRLAAKEGRGADFIKLNYGLCVKNSDRPVKVEVRTVGDKKEVAFIIRETEFVATHTRGKYQIKTEIEEVTVIPNYPRAPAAPSVEKEEQTEVKTTKEQKEPIWFDESCNTKTKYTMPSMKTEWLKGNELEKWETAARKEQIPEEIIAEMKEIAIRNPQPNLNRKEKHHVEQTDTDTHSNPSIPKTENRLRMQLQHTAFWNECIIFLGYPEFVIDFEEECRVIDHARRC
jgi:Bacteriophage replication gene A protein (GPA)